MAKEPAITKAIFPVSKCLEHLRLHIQSIVSRCQTVPLQIYGSSQEDRQLGFVIQAAI